MKTAACAGRAKLTLDGKREIAKSMYEKSKGYLGAALLLRKHGGNEYVFLHLLCQSIEIFGKGYLLSVNYYTHMPKLKGYGHDLMKLASAVKKEAPFSGANVFCHGATEELKKLNSLYKKHLLRYGCLHDLSVKPETIPSRRVLARVVSLMKCLDRKLSAQAPSTAT